MDLENLPRRNTDVDSRDGMLINLDRGHHIRSFLSFWIIYLAVGAALVILLMRFTNSKLIAFGLAGGMFLYMIIAAAITSRNLEHSADDGRLD
jgi:hypothetical protein